jgi:secreted trypsin-like serine protease
MRGDDPEGDVQVGIVSWGIGCGYMPGVFSRVSTGYAWIQETVCGTSTDPPGSLCGSTETQSEWRVLF